MKALFKSFPMVCFIVPIDPPPPPPPPPPIYGWSWSVATLLHETQDVLVRGVGHASPEVFVKSALLHSRRSSQQ